MKTIEEIRQALKAERIERDVYLECNCITRHTSNNLGEAFTMAGEAIHGSEEAALRLQQLETVTTKDEAAGVVAAACQQLERAQSGFVLAETAFSEFQIEAEAQLKAVCTKYGLDFEELEEVGVDDMPEDAQEE